MASTRLLVLVSLSVGLALRAGPMLVRADPISGSTASQQHLRGVQSGDRLSDDLVLDRATFPASFNEALANLIQQRALSASSTNEPSADLRSWSFDYMATPPKRSPLPVSPAPHLTESRGFRALLDDYRQLARQSLPSRQSRAFKPRHMSTARGFGKRAYTGPYSEPVISAKSNEYAATAATDSLLRLPLIGKYINEKLVDYNG